MGPLSRVGPRTVSALCPCAGSQMHSTPEGRQSPHDSVSKSLRDFQHSNPPCSLSRGCSGPASLRLLHHHGCNVSRKSNHTCGHQRRDCTPSSEGQTRTGITSYRKRVAHAGSSTHCRSERTTAERMKGAFDQRKICDRGPTGRARTQARQALVPACLLGLRSGKHENELVLLFHSPFKIL